MTNEEMAEIAEAVRVSLSPDFKEIINELKEIKTQMGQIEDRVINLEKNLRIAKLQPPFWQRTYTCSKTEQNERTNSQFRK